MTEVLVPAARVPRWVANFETRHGSTRLQVEDGQLTGTAADGESFRARLPFAASYAGSARPDDFAEAALAPSDWGVLLVRKGGFAIARVAGLDVMESKVGQRHVQGRTKAGGQSQQRFARRRDNQARVAYEAAAGHAARILAGTPAALVCGGDRAAVDAVLEDPRLRHLAPVRVDPWLTVPDPRRSVLDRAVLDAASVAVSVTG